MIFSCRVPLKIQFPAIAAITNQVVTDSSIVKQVILRGALYIDIDVLGMVRIESIAVDVSYAMAPLIESNIESPNSATAVIEDITNNNIHYLHNDGSVNTELNNAILVSGLDS